jgi:hypothetical protein
MIELTEAAIDAAIWIICVGFFAVLCIGWGG